jgi:DNA-binding IclR family transcriptional regulator
MSNDTSDPGKSSHGIQVISRAAEILRALKEVDDGMSLGQIARRVDLPRSTVQRIVKALTAERLVVAGTAGGGFRLGPEIQSLAAAGKQDIADIVRPSLAALSGKTGETVDLAELRSNRLVFIDQIVGTHRLRTVATVGESFPLTSTANGKASLALLSDGAVLDLIEQELQTTDGQQQDRRALIEEVEETRRRGFAYDIDEHTDGVSAVGAAFRDANRQIYAISIPAPSHRFAGDRQRLTSNLVETMSEIKSLLG